MKYKVQLSQEYEVEANGFEEALIKANEQFISELADKNCNMREVLNYDTEIIDNE